MSLSGEWFLKKKPLEIVLGFVKGSLLAIHCVGGGLLSRDVYRLVSWATIPHATDTDFSSRNWYIIQNKQKNPSFSKSVTSPDPDMGSKLRDGFKDLRIYKRHKPQIPLTAQFWNGALIFIVKLHYCCRLKIHCWLLLCIDFVEQQSRVQYLMGCSSNWSSHLLHRGFNQLNLSITYSHSLCITALHKNIKEW